MTKKKWASPTLSNHGSIESITQNIPTRNKEFGSFDGDILNGEGLRTID